MDGRPLTGIAGSHLSQPGLYWVYGPSSMVYRRRSAVGDRRSREHPGFQNVHFRTETSTHRTV